MDTEAEEELVREFEIAHIPSLLLFRDGILLFNQPSNFSEEELENVIAQAEALDMDEVRSKLSSPES
jgi:thioredoxin 1